jgi:hypothetical protein
LNKTDLKFTHSVTQKDKEKNIREVKKHKREEKKRRVVEGVNSSMIYLIHYNNLCKCPHTAQ